MIRRIILLGALAGLTLAFLPADKADDTRGEVIVVKMVDKSPTEYAFEPNVITAKHGDVIRFVQTSTTPHNVQFKDVPAGTNLGDAAMGPFLTAPDQTYEITIDDRFAAGEHKFVCTPHEFMGMTGTLTVEAGN